VDASARLRGEVREEVDGELTVSREPQHGVDEDRRVSADDEPAAADLAGTLLRRGGTPVLVLLTDARAKIARNGAPGRDLATADALASARQLRALGLGMLVVDTAPGASRPAAGAGPTVARQLSDALNARYLPLPQMDAAMLSRAARSLATPDNGRRPA
jgi:hypothetical protein